MLKKHYIVPVGNNYLIHFPLRKMDVLVDRDLLQKIQDFHQGKPTDEPLSDYIHQNELVLEEQESEPKKYTGFNPSSITIFPTSDCNLRCVYCYGNAGIVKRNLTWDIAKKAVDYLIQNNTEQEGIHLGFHGGGEPLIRFDFVKTCVGYSRREAEKKEIKLHVGSTTNGVLGQNQLEWIVENFDSLSISIDGPKDIQNKQRPDAYGRGSYDKVMRTIEYLQDKEFEFGTRSTITQFNVKRMSEIVEFFSEHDIKRVHFEPLFFCGRCTTTGWDAPDEDVFVEEFKKTYKRAKELGISLYYSGSRPGNVTRTFCGAAGKNFCVTPEGYISSCYEVTSSNDPKSKTFFYGKVSEQGIEIFQNKLETLQRKTVDANPTCSSCFIKWNCGGECLAKYYMEGPSTSRCNINKELSLFQIVDKIENSQQTSTPYQ